MAERLPIGDLSLTDRIKFNGKWSAVANAITTCGDPNTTEGIARVAGVTSSFIASGQGALPGILKASGIVDHEVRGGTDALMMILNDETVIPEKNRSTDPIMVALKAFQESVEHYFPSKAKLDPFVLKADAIGAADGADVFLAHSGANKSEALRIYMFLELTGLNVWFDVSDVGATSPLYNEVIGGLSKTKHLLALVTKDGFFDNNRPWPQKETWSYIVHRHTHKGDRPVTPFLLDLKPEDVRDLGLTVDYTLVKEGSSAGPIVPLGKVFSDTRMMSKPELTAGALVELAAHMKEFHPHVQVPSKAKAEEMFDAISKEIGTILVAPGQRSVNKQPLKRSMEALRAQPFEDASKQDGPKKQVSPGEPNKKAKSEAAAAVPAPVPVAPPTRQSKAPTKTEKQDLISFFASDMIGRLECDAMHDQLLDKDSKDEPTMEGYGMRIQGSLKTAARNYSNDKGYEVAKIIMDERTEAWKSMGGDGSHIHAWVIHFEKNFMKFCREHNLAIHSIIEDYIQYFAS